MNKDQIIHDLTVALASKSADNPETIVVAYRDLLPKVKEAYDSDEPPKAKAKIMSRREFFGNPDD